MEVLSKVPLEQEVLDLVCQKESHYDILTIQGEKFVLASAVSKGYREYKVSDNYTNKIIALTLAKIL